MVSAYVNPVLVVSSSMSVKTYLCYGVTLSVLHLVEAQILTVLNCGWSQHTTTSVCHFCVDVESPFTRCFVSIRDLG